MCCTSVIVQLDVTFSRVIVEWKKFNTKQYTPVRHNTIFLLSQRKQYLANPPACHLLPPAARSDDYWNVTNIFTTRDFSVYATEVTDV